MLIVAGGAGIAYFVFSRRQAPVDATPVPLRARDRVAPPPPQPSQPPLFERGMDFVQQMRAQIQNNLRAALEALHAIERVRVVSPLGGMYMFPEILDCNDEEALLEKMLAVGLFAHPGYFYDEERGCHLMISGLLETPRLRAGIERLKQVLCDE